MSNHAAASRRFAVRRCKGGFAKRNPPFTDHHEAGVSVRPLARSAATLFVTTETQLSAAVTMS
jgi:hypothetical protein